MIHCLEACREELFYCTATVASLDPNCVPFVQTSRKVVVTESGDVVAVPFMPSLIYTRPSGRYTVQLSAFMLDQVRRV